MPGAGCTVPGCTSRLNKRTSFKLRMVRYPKDEELKKCWLTILGRPDWTPYGEARVCELHFLSDQWSSPFRLKKGALPTSTAILCSCKKGASPPAAAHSHDHCYAQKASASCKLHGSLTSSTIVEVTKENIELQKRVCGLQRQLHGEATDTFSTPLKSLENIKVLSSRKKYTTEDIRKGLQIRFSCGSTGYNTVRNLLSKDTKLPSIRLLQLETEHIIFKPGILHEVLHALKERFAGLSDVRDRDVVLVFDEMSTKKRIDWDPSTGEYIGWGTIPGHEHLHAEKGEIFVLRGCHRKFKQIVAYHLNPTSVNMDQKKLVIMELLQKAKDIGANVVAIVCDCGNRTLLRKLGFGTQKNNLKYCIPNPISPDLKLRCVADPVHVFKSLKECLCSNRFIELPASIVSQFDLPSAMVNIEHIAWLEKFQRDESLQMVPGLTFKDLSTTHFSKMKVKSSHKVINHKVGAALSYLVLKGLVPEAFETTAWFIKLMNRWFELTTSRSCQLAFGLKNEVAYNAAVDHLKLVVTVFQGVNIAGGWKPVQSHIIFSTKSLLEITDHLIREKNYQFVLTGNFTSDVVENIVSRVRITRPTPSGLELKTRLNT
ncbi:uncharacterized protein LOC117648325 [Thrips palmi]|uniref:Uncharacterized protein LOC117648325 n=1 Tax=Thrips palmi TaxID=161013 RepID=A0A6P8Z2H3_THRPL|nr:uncharacterized protein LOC117648325 [Thrips palmi]